MMHLQAIVERNAKARSAHPHETDYHINETARAALRRVGKAPWHASEPLPFDDAHPHGLHECAPSALNLGEVVRNLAPSVPLILDTEDRFAPG